MPDQSPHQGRRPHFHRGRRGPDRRGGERRTAPSSSEPAARDHVDVEQIMRDIRARISQRHGIELSNQQVQELAARRLEAILEPRNVNPSLLEQLRKSAGATVDVPPPAPEAGYEFTPTTLYDTHRGVLRVLRKLLNPVLKLFFNPTPLIEALQAQAQINRAAAARDAERDRRQAEWNALHYELLQHMVAEVSRISIDIQALSSRVESLSAKVDFNDRRVRGLENPGSPGRPQPRPVPPADAAVATSGGIGDNGTGDAADGGNDATRRRRRRRRGRRSGAGVPEGVTAGDTALATDADEGEAGDGENGEDLNDAAAADESGPAEDSRAVAFEPAHAISPLQPLEPHPTPVEAVRPEPPRDEPTPAAPTDHADPGPPDR